MTRKSVNVNWTEQTFNYSGHAAIRHFMVEATNDLNEVGDFNLQKPTAKENRLSCMKRSCTVVNITEEAFELQYKRVFGYNNVTEEVSKVELSKAGAAAPVRKQEEDKDDPWTTRFYL